MNRSQLASRLGRLARGVRKKFSAAELRRRTERIIAAGRAYRAGLKKAKKLKKKTRK